MRKEVRKQFQMDPPLSVTQQVFWAWPPAASKGPAQRRLPTVREGQDPASQQSRGCRKEASFSVRLALLTRFLILKALMRSQVPVGLLDTAWEARLCVLSCGVPLSPEMARGVRKSGLTAAVQRGHRIQGQGLLSPEAGPWESSGGVRTE